jgi:signal transduction histidine kinase
VTWFAPLAVLGDRGRVLRFANDAWHAQFEGTDHIAFTPHVCQALDHGVEVRVDTLALGDRTCAAVIYPFDDWAIVAVAPPAAARRRNEIATPPAATMLRHHFVEFISHELRSPIATTALWVEVLRDAATPELRKRAADAIADSCTRQSQMVADLLDLARGLGGRLQIDRRPVEIDTLLQETIVATTAAAAVKEITFEHTFDDSLGLVTGDAARLRQVFDLLVGNAIEQTPTGGRVAISARRVDDLVEIAICDSGPGATAEQLATIFEPFGAHFAGAIGPRLALAQHLIRLHGGSLDASSDGVDCGLLLTLTLPSIT